MTRPRSLLLASLLVALVVTVVVVGSEVVSRALRTFVCDGRGPTFHELQADYGWKHTAASRFYSHGCIARRYEYRTLVEINTKGLRDREYAYERTPGVPRVLVLGDSVVEAAQVNTGEDFPSVLEDRFSKDGKPVEVLNTGVAGFGTDNALLYFRHEGVRYAPDVVVAVFNIHNDVAENSLEIFESTGGVLPRARVEIDAQGRMRIDTRDFGQRLAELEQKKGPAEHPFVTWLRPRLYLYRRLERLLAAPATELPAPSARLAMAADNHTIMATVFADPPPPPWEAAWKLTAALYRELNAEVSNAGARLVVLVVPTREMVSEVAWMEFFRKHPPPDALPRTRDSPRRRAADMFRGLGIPYVDATDPMTKAAAESGRTGFYAYDPHPDAEGHRRLAAALEPALREALTK